MAGTKISQLPPLPSPLGTDIFPVTQSGTTYKETVTQLSGILNATLTFLPIAGGTMSGAINMGANQINNMADPVLSQDAATKNYVDAVAVGLNILPSVYAASTAPLTVTYANGASGVGATLTNAGAQVTFVLDSINPPLNSRILIKDQSSTLQNGIYTVTNVGSGATNWVLTRSTDYDTPSQINPGDFVLVDNGTVNTATAWIETATVTTIGTDPILFSAFASRQMAANSIKGNNTGSTGPILDLTVAQVNTLLATGSPLASAWKTGIAAVPSFSAYNSVVTTCTANGYTKIAFQTKEFDVGGYFDNVTNYRYTPLLSGIYLVNATIGIIDANVTSNTQYNLALYKNGVAMRFGSYGVNLSNLTNSSLSTYVSMNGSTDYLEVFFFNGNGATTLGTNNSQLTTFFSASYVGPAT